VAANPAFWHHKIQSRRRTTDTQLVGTPVVVLIPGTTGYAVRKIPVVFKTIGHSSDKKKYVRRILRRMFEEKLY